MARPDPSAADADDRWPGAARPGGGFRESGPPESGSLESGPSESGSLESGSPGSAEVPPAPLQPMPPQPVEPQPVEPQPVEPQPLEPQSPPPAGPPRPVHETRGPSEFALGGVLLVVVIGLALVGQDHWRRGLLLAGIGLVAGAVVRLVLPARVAGLLVVRGRVFDAVVLAVLGAAVIALTSSVPLPSGSG